MDKLTKEYIEITLQEEKLWKVGEGDIFIFNEWELILSREEKIYKPFTYLVVGRNNDGSFINRRYKSMDEAFLHIVNKFNEDSNIKNKYQSIWDFIRSK